MIKHPPEESKPDNQPARSPMSPDSFAVHLCPSGPETITVWLETLTQGIGKSNATDITPEEAQRLHGALMEVLGPYMEVAP